jgi:hypothetical protein
MVRIFMRWGNLRGEKSRLLLTKAINGTCRKPMTGIEAAEVYHLLPGRSFYCSLQVTVTRCRVAARNIQAGVASQLGHLVDRGAGIDKVFAEGVA